MNVLLLPLGSAGDVLPFIWLGRRLRERGHRIVMITSCPFADAAGRAGFDFLPLDEEGDYERLIADPKVWKLFTGTAEVFRFAGQATEMMASRIEQLLARDQRPDLMLASSMGYGARLMRELHGIPLVNTHLQPAVMVSAHEPPVLFPGMEGFRRWPLFLRRALLRGPNPADMLAGPAIRRACHARGVKPPRRPFWQWSHSPDGALALFPSWFAAPQPDWPEPLWQWDFPLEDLADQQPLEADLQRFLDAGDKPFVFTPGSANVHGRRFFAVAAEAVAQLGRRAVFVTRDPGQTPPNAGDHVFTAAWAPFSTLLQHAAGFIHHGGIGTMSQGFAAAVPQLIMPMAHDQPDNAWRLRQLDAGLSLPPKRFTVDRVVHALRQLLDNDTIRAGTAACARRCRQRQPVEPLLAWLEAAAARDRKP